MSFHVYIEPDLELKLDALCRKTGQKRNTLVRDALREYVNSRLKATWPEDVFRFKPDPDLVPFESLRGDLLPERDDMFAEPK